MNAKRPIFLRAQKEMTSGVVVMFALALPIWSQRVKHPLDGLTASEIWTAYEVLET